MVRDRRHEYRLDMLRRWTQNCGCDKYPCDHTFYEDMLFSGDDAYRDHKSLRGAFNKGMAAWQAGEEFYAGNPYSGGARRTDRKGRHNRGFRAAFDKAWQAGWAWAEYSDPMEVALRSLGTPAKDFDDPDRWRRPLDEP